jgi:hypothetical protein
MELATASCAGRNPRPIAEADDLHRGFAQAPKQMRIVVEDVTEDLFVSASCLAGRIRGRWKSSRGVLPVVGREYDVEVDIVGPVSLNAATPIDEAATVGRVWLEEQSVVLECLVEAVDEDGILTVRLSRDCLIMIEVAVDASAPHGRVRMFVDEAHLELTPTGIV